MDAKPRELYLLFRAYEGYEGSLLKVTSKNGKTASVSTFFFLLDLRPIRENVILQRPHVFYKSLFLIFYCHFASG